MNIIHYFIQTGSTVPFLYIIISCMIESRDIRKIRVKYFIKSCIVTLCLDGLLFFLGISPLSIVNFGPLTMIIPGFICLFYTAKIRDMSFVFIFTCITVLILIINNVAYLLSYFIFQNNWIITCIINMLLLFSLYHINKYYLSEKFITTVNNYNLEWGCYIMLPFLYYIIRFTLFILSSHLNIKVTMKTFYTFDLSDQHKLILLLILLATFYAIMLVLSIIVKNHTFVIEQEEKKTLQFQINSLKHLQQHYDEKNESLRIYRHDMRHHFNSILLLLQNGNITEAQNYLKEISNNLSSTKTTSYCSNVVINSLLSYYNDRCQEDDIQFQCIVKLNDHSLKLILDTELGAVVSNILENALHAVLKMPKNKKRYIIFQLLHKNQQYILQCENSFSNLVYLSQDGRPISKEEGHGIGTRSILAFEHKYNATTSYKVLGSSFTIRLLFSEVV